MNTRRHAGGNGSIIDIRETRHRPARQPAMSPDADPQEIRHKPARHCHIEIFICRPIQANDNDRCRRRPVNAPIDSKFTHFVGTKKGRLSPQRRPLSYCAVSEAAASATTNCGRLGEPSLPLATPEGPSRFENKTLWKKSTAQ